MQKPSLLSLTTTKTLILFLLILPLCILLNIFLHPNFLHPQLTRLRFILSNTASSAALPNVVSQAPAPVKDVCLIMSCLDRLLPYSQQFSHPSFRRVLLDLSEEVVRTHRHPVWCRVSQLRALRKQGHQCVIFIDDDVYLNLTQTRIAIDEASRDHVLVGSNENFGKSFNINAGHIIFTDLQGRFSAWLLYQWHKMMHMDRYQIGLRDQHALNDIIHCNMSNVDCFHLHNRQKLGQKGHCHSAKDRDDPGSRAVCMRKKKAGVREWDADPL